ncbi:Patatin [Emticicia oligotrophica DSM 17448]|uniref:Patatin n=1 Tax=Emticicia oligotrophica (strain DSM 17448 / CIP 109782 / MTCC 6937 / GPTSA100-15) TaxID=929562 RepID=A0ABM5MZZ0_EMTOG|nr:patatin-like phospholipase family protein [Emticicia oligotrophica]AFK02623.1 Patatin [Emticicia oligotrophica DSM 17448]
MLKYIKTIFLISFSVIAFAQQKVYRNLIMEGGGIKGVAYGGALKELESRGVLQQIQRVGGTSAGAIQACLLAVGYSADEIAQIIAETPIETFNDGGSVIKASERFVKKFGWYKGENFLTTIQKLITDRTGKPNLTFAELHELAKSIPYRDLYVTGVNLTKQRLEVFSYETYPEMRVCDAVRVSMSIPLYYQSVFLNAKGKVIENPIPSDSCDVFVDGGLLMNYPIELFDQTKYLSTATDSTINKPTFNTETLGLRLERCEQIDHEIHLKEGFAPFEIQDFKGYISALYNIMTESVDKPKPEDIVRTIYINDNGMSPKVRKLSEGEKQKMMISGQQGVIEFFYR